MSVNRPLITRIRFQLGGALILAVLLPGMIRSGGYKINWEPSTLHASAGCLIALLVGFFMIRRLGDLPGVRSGSHVLISISVAYVSVIIVFLVFRLEYSRFVFILSYVMAAAWFLILHFFVLQRIKPGLLIVPGGNSDKLQTIRGVEWKMLSSPTSVSGHSAAVVADLRSDLSEEWKRFLSDCAIAGVPVYHSKQIAESLTGEVEIEHLSENTLGSILPSNVYLRLKLWIDFAFALLLFPVFLLLCLIVASVIVKTSGRPIFYKSRRIGFRGKEFIAYKFRTMHNETTGDSSALDPVHSSITKDNDERVTPFGRFLRRTRIDELPQIINVLFGEMSWIGPRPEVKALSQWYEDQIPFYRYRHVVRPGITGWAQVNQGHVASPQEVQKKLHFDFFYIKNISLWLDLLIAMRTIVIVVSGYGAK